MKKIFFLITVLLLCSNSFFCQEKINEFVLDLKKKNSRIVDVFPLIHEDSGEFVLFISDATHVFLYKFNENFELINKMMSEKKQRKFNSLLGYYVSDNGSYNLILKNKNFTTQFLRINFSFDKLETLTEEFRIKNNQIGFKHSFVESFSYLNRFYIITSIFEDENFYIHTFENEKLVSHVLGENFKNILNKKNKKSSFGELIHKDKNNLSVVDESLPNSIEIAAEPIKLYKRGESLLFCFDQSSLKTQILELNLTNFKQSYKEFLKPMLEEKNKKVSNSFIYKNTISLIAATKNKASITIKDLEKKQTLKTYNLHKDHPITFKNSPIIQVQEGGLFDAYREIKGTNNFLRKINSGKIGVSLINVNDNFKMTVGGYKEINTVDGRMPMMGGGFGGTPSGSFGAFTDSMNPTQFAFSSYSSSKSVRIHCLLNKNFESIEGKIPKNSFDIINDYEDGLKFAKSQNVRSGIYNSSEKIKTPPSTTSVSNLDSSANIVFKYNDYLIKTYYNRSNKKFDFLKF